MWTPATFLHTTEVAPSDRGLAVRGARDDVAMTSPDRTIAHVALGQHGIFTTAQAEAAGFSAAQIRSRVESGQWERRMRGVLALAGVAPTALQRAAVAHLSRPGSALSHQTAAVVLGLVDVAHHRPTITVPPGGSGRSPLARVHRLVLPPDDLTRVGGLAVTTPARTLVDCATEVGARRLRAIVDRAMHERRSTVARIQQALGSAHHLTRQQRDAVLDAIDVWRPDLRPGSPAEARLLRQIDEWGLPAPQRQLVIRNGAGAIIARVDAGWDDRRLALEYDGAEWHGPSQWAHDERRHALLMQLGWRVLRVAAPDLKPGSDLRQRITAAYLAIVPIAS